VDPAVRVPKRNEDIHAPRLSSMSPVEHEPASELRPGGQSTRRQAAAGEADGSASSADSEAKRLTPGPSPPAPLPPKKGCSSRAHAQACAPTLAQSHALDRVP
jgi:hypothetical protein